MTNEYDSRSVNLWYPEDFSKISEGMSSTYDTIKWTERHIQCIWYDPQFRPQTLTTTDGEELQIINPGKWNLEAGPDFIDAEIKDIKTNQVIRGDVEIHIRPIDWFHHHHNTDSNYNNVVLHVTWYGEYSATPPLPNAKNIVLREQIIRNRNFSFDAIPIGNYPHATFKDNDVPCAKIFSQYTSEQKKQLLQSAGESRLRRKTADLTVKYNESGNIKQLFQDELFYALGYKNNSLPFHELSSRVTNEKLCSLSSTIERYALLLANAGLLPSTPQTDLEREIWDIAWRMGCADAGLQFPYKWCFANTRPQNNPKNRMILAAILGGSKELFTQIVSTPTHDPKKWWKAIEKIFKDIINNPNNTIEGVETHLGSSRIASIAINIVIPLLSIHNPSAINLATGVKGEDLNSNAKETAFRLFGRDHNPALYKNNALLQQGLLEIWYRFCIGARIGCEGCPLTKTLSSKDTDL